MIITLYLLYFLLVVIVFGLALAIGGFLHGLGIKFALWWTDLVLQWLGLI